MATKLTLYIDDSVIYQAKKYAKAMHTSVSRMVEQYFRSLKPKQKTQKISPDIHALRGVYKTSRKIDDKKILLDVLRKKYL